MPLNITNEGVKVLAAGSTVAPVKPGVTRLYSMRFCPFAHRARLALAFTKTEYETVNVHLVKKPDFFLEKNPGGQVPVYEKDGKVVYGSLVVAEYVASLCKGCNLLPADAYERAQDAMIINDFDGKYVGNFFKTIGVEGGDADAVEAMAAALKKLEHHLVAVDTDYMRGKAPTYLDIAVWPFFERLSVLSTLNRGKIDMDLFPKLKAWQQRMKEQEAVKFCARSDELHAKFVQEWKGGSENPYDLGL